MFIIISGAFFCGFAVGVAICSFRRPLWRHLSKHARKLIAARIAEIGKPRRAKVVRLRVA